MFRVKKKMTYTSLCSVGIQAENACGLAQRYQQNTACITQICYVYSSVVTHTTRTRQENGRLGQSPTPKSSPEPRYRLRSNSQGLKKPRGTSTGTQEPTTPTTFFSLETGVYVPTQVQCYLFLMHVMSHTHTHTC